MAKKTDAQRQALPPYIPFKTFQGFIQKLHDTTAPPRVDASLLRSYSGSMGRGLVAALKYLGLIGENGQTNELLKVLVKSYGTPDWQSDLSNIIGDAYHQLIGDLDLDNATRGQLEEKFKTWGAEGQLLQKCITFYIAALRNGGLTFSPHIAERPPRKPRTAGGARRGKQARETDSPQQGIVESPQSGVVRFAFPIPEKSPATIFLPADLATEDWEMIESMVRAYIQRKAKK